MLIIKKNTAETLSPVEILFKSPKSKKLKVQSPKSKIFGPSQPVDFHVPDFFHMNFDFGLYLWTLDFSFGLWTLVLDFGL